MPADAHAGRDGVAAEASFFLDRSSKGHVLERAIPGIAPARHADRPQAPVGIDNIGNVGGLAMSGESTAKVVIIDSYPCDVGAAKSGGQPDGLNYPFSLPVAVPEAILLTNPA